MDLTLTDEQELLATTAREFLADRCPSAHVRAMADDPLGYSTQLWQELAQLGWTAMALPASHGGSDAGLLDLCLVIEEMGRVLLPSPFVPTVVLGALPVARFGTAAQRDRLLPAVAAGRDVVSFGWSGPDGRWDLADVGVVAEDVGDDVVLTGIVLFVPYAQAADHLLLVARRAGGTPGDVTVFVVDTDTPGLTRERLDTTGPAPECRVILDGVRVDRSQVLGGVDEGRAVAEWVLGHGTAARCAEMLGGAQRVLDMTVAYATQREQFGRAIGGFQAVQHQCADMAMDVLGARFIAYEAIWRLGEGLDATTDVSLAKAWVSDAYTRVCAAAHQIHGAIGFTEEHDLHLYLRHATDAELAFGDADHHLEVVARSLGL